MATRTSRKWFAIRVTLLLAVLVVVALYAWRDVTRRKARNDWKRTLDVAIVLVRDGAVSEPALGALRSETRSLEAALEREYARYRRDSLRPFAFVAFGPVPLGRTVPEAQNDGLVAAAKYAWQLSRFTSDIDTRAGVPSRGFDARIYVVVRAPSGRGLVEGASEHGGRVGVALSELDESTVGLTAFVAAHELFHTLGATDRYGPDGRTSIPDGLAEPDRQPVFHRTTPSSWRETDRSTPAEKCRRRRSTSSGSARKRPPKSVGRAIPEVRARRLSARAEEASALR